MREQNHAKVGDHYEVLNQNFRVCGIVEHGKGARRYLPIATLQDLLGSEGKASMFYVKTDTPENAEAAVTAIKQIPGMDQYVARSVAEYASLMTVSNIPFLGTFINIVIGNLGDHRLHRDLPVDVHGGDGTHPGDWNSQVAGRHAALHRERGAARIAAAGHRRSAAGPGVYGPGSAAINYRFPLHRMVWDAHWVLRAAIIAIAGALLGGLYPALRAAQKDPIEALAYE